MRVQLLLGVFAISLMGCGGEVFGPVEGDVQIDAVEAPEPDDLASLEAAIEGTMLPTLEETHRGRINTHRASHVGRRALSMRLCLRERARTHSRAMAASGNLFHTENLLGKISRDCPAMTLAGVGENVGVGFDELQLFRAFLASPAHHANIDRGYWDQIGVGIFKETSGRLWITQIYANWQ